MYNENDTHLLHELILPVVPATVSPFVPTFRLEPEETPYRFSSGLLQRPESLPCDTVPSIRPWPNVPCGED